MVQFLNLVNLIIVQSVIKIFVINVILDIFWIFKNNATIVLIIAKYAIMRPNVHSVMKAII